MEWIDVKIRLPNTGTDVLVGEAFEGGIINAFVANLGREWRVNCPCNSYNVAQDITHWMPLPELPEGE